MPQSPTSLRQNVKCVILVSSDIRCHYEWNKHSFYVQSFSISAPALWAPEEQGQNWEFVLVWVWTIALSQTAYLSTNTYLIPNDMWYDLGDHGMIWYDVVWYVNVAHPGGGYKT